MLLFMYKIQGTVEFILKWNLWGCWSSNERIDPLTLKGILVKWISSLHCPTFICPRQRSSSLIFFSCRTLLHRSLFSFLFFRASSPVVMADDANDVEKLYEYGERLNEAKDKSEVRTPRTSLGFLFYPILYVRVSKLCYCCLFAACWRLWRYNQRSKGERQGETIGCSAHSQVLQILPQPHNQGIRCTLRFVRGRRAWGDSSNFILYLSLFIYLEL